MHALKFVGLSVAGFLFFLLPFPIAGEWKIAMSHIVGAVKEYALQPFLIATQVCAAIVATGTALFAFYTSSSSALNEAFKTSWLGVAARIAGSLLYVAVVRGWVIELPVAQLLFSDATGGVMAGAEGLLTTLYVTFFVGLLALPLLTHFGAVEFFGVALGRVVSFLFKVPGYSAVDAIASFVGDGTIGIVVTDTQYQRGYYNRREAFVIATSFSIVGIAFASAVAEELQFADIFPLFYGSVAFVTVVLAFITCRLPLKGFPPTYFPGAEPKRVVVPEGVTVLRHAWNSSVDQARTSSLVTALRDALAKIAHVYIGYLPIIMLVGTVALVIAENTGLFSVLSTPLEPVYRLVGYAPAVAAEMAPASIVGFADMYLPALIIKGSASEPARFFVGVLAFTQLVFMSETGMVLLRSKIGLRFRDVVFVFLFRTLLSLPILVALTEVFIAMGILSR